VAEQFAELLRIALPDPEEELSRWVGDILAYRAGDAARSARDWTFKALDALTADTAEYLTEEGRVLPTRYEADALFTDIERLRDDVERTEARIDRLAAQHGSLRRRPRVAGAETS
jgi:ubiquinone biosynthesis protein UbiJ